MITISLFRAGATEFDYTYDFSPHLLRGGVFSGQCATLRNISVTPTDFTAPYDLSARLEPITPADPTETLTIRSKNIAGFSYLGQEIAVPTDAEGSWVLRVVSSGKGQDATLSFSFTVDAR